MHEGGRERVNLTLFLGLCYGVMALMFAQSKHNHQPQPSGNTAAEPALIIIIIIIIITRKCKHWEQTKSASTYYIYSRYLIQIGRIFRTRLKHLQHDLWPEIYLYNYTYNNYIYIYIYQNSGH